MSIRYAPTPSTPAQPSAVDTRFEVGLRLTERHGERSPREFEMFGLRWDLLPEVFAPVHTDSTELFTGWMPFPVGGSFLEVGCGAGVTAVMAALAGCARVTAVDISPDAVRNAELNAERHGVADKVRVLRSDLYDALPPDERFDVVFWNSNVICAPDEFVYVRQVQHAIFDRGYVTHERYLREGLARLTDSGHLFLGFNSLGASDRLNSLASESGLLITQRESSTLQSGGVPVTFQLLEVTGDGNGRKTA